MATSPLIVAIYSPVPRSGKTTFAEVLKDQGYHHVRFSAPLIAAARAILKSAGCHELLFDALYASDAKDTAVIPELGTTIRTVLQNIGQGMRSVDPTFWVRILEQRIEKLSSFHRDGCGYFVVDDLRYPNEYLALANKKYRTVFVKITRPDAPGLNTEHESEGMLDHFEFDYEFTNDGPKDKLRSFAHELSTDLLFI